MLLYSGVSKDIIDVFFEVYNTLGHGFLERVYKNAMYLELKEAGYTCETEKQINVYYKGKNVGIYYADMVIENQVILELKAVERIAKAHEYQLINYLRATTYEVGYVLNFGVKPEFKRIFFTNDKK